MNTGANNASLYNNLLFKVFSQKEMEVELLFFNRISSLRRGPYAQGAQLDDDMAFSAAAPHRADKL